MTEAVDAMCEQLIKAVTVMMDSETNQRYRLEALKFCEEFKEKCPYCIPCGIQLADKSQVAVVRHFGLQILEHVIKFQWNDMPQQEKVHLKDCIMEMLTNGTYPILDEESHIKDALSRIVVEMIKREWPQQWPDMLKEMETLTTFGDTQTELVMLILLRLAEDVITFQTLPHQRRRDIQHTLTQNMDSIFNFLLTILQQHVDEYRNLKVLPGQELKAKAHCRVSVTTLNTLAGYTDWVALIHITNNSCRLLEILCLLLSEPELQLEAAECLLIAISRKGKLEDRKPLMVLFDDVAMHYILSAAQSVEVGPSEIRYTFLKRLCQVLCALGSQLCALVGSPAEVEVPANLGKYLEAFLAFTSHPSQFLRSCTQTTWGNIFRQEVLSKEPVVIQMVVKYLNATMTNLVKSGFPSKNDSPACEYTRVDFDSDEDFNAFFHSFRAQQGDVIRHSCKIAPLEAFQIAGEWLQYQLNLNTGNALTKTAAQWEAMTFFTDSVMGTLFKVLEKEKLPVDQGMELLKAVVNYETHDPVILSCILTNLSTLFPFVLHRPEFLPQVFFKRPYHRLASIRHQLETHNSLFLPENLSRLSEPFARAYDVMDVEKNLILGISQPLSDVYDSPVYKSALERTQGFFCTLYDNCYHVLGHAGPALQQDFYTIEGLLEKLVGSALIHLEQVPDHRLRPLLHILYSLLCPLLGLLFSHLLQRLNLRWQIINQRTSVCGPDDDEAYEENQVSQEMLEDRLVRLATREVMDLLCASCISRKSPEPTANREDADGDDEMMATDSSQLTASQSSDELTELGKCLLKHEDIYMNLLAISFNSLSWRDTTNCQRAATLICWSLLRQVVGANLLPDAVVWLYTRVLSGLQMHGQHDGCSAALTQLALLIYDALRPQYPELRIIMNQIPNVQRDLLEQFDQKTINPASQKVGEKKRKDQFKKLIAGAVGKPLGQQFKKEVHIRNLPSLYKKVKPNKDILVNSENAGLVALFSPEHDEH
ncbi:exportin-5 [Tachysurus ichikawai]